MLVQSFPTVRRCPAAAGVTAPEPAEPPARGFFSPEPAEPPAHGFI